MEQIYTIPVNEAFEECMRGDICACPLCRIHDKLESDEVERILGPAMMEPDTRIETNKKGFCKDHFEMLLKGKNKLSLALMLESHLDEIIKNTKDGAFSGIIGGKGKNTARVATELEDSCYVCDRIEPHFKRMIETVVLLFTQDPKFAEKLTKQEYFCLPHYTRLVEYARLRLDKKAFSQFYKAISTIETAYLEELKNDVSWFTKKYDYRYENEPWYNSKDAVERAISLLSAKIEHVPERKNK